MTRLRRHAILALFLLLCGLPAVGSAQQIVNTPPHVGYIYPAGGQRGTTFQVIIGGQFLDSASNVRITGGGVQANVLGIEKPLTGVQALELRDKLKVLQDKRIAALGSKGRPSTAPAFTEADAKMVEEIRARLKKFMPKVASPSIAETATLQITISPNADPSQRELRLMTPAGLSNPIIFCVSQVTEFAEPASKAVLSETAMPITLPAVVNGQIMPGGMNRYRFQAHRGDHVVCAVAARDLVPYIADAVPGWFQATLGIYDANGAELAYADHWQFHPDPVLYFEVARDGEYTIEIKDSLYRGREDFVYRITVGEMPFVTSIFPLGGRVGSKGVVELQGWNLPETRVLPAMSAGGETPLYVNRGLLSSNRVPFAVDALPECDQHRPNDSIASAQQVTLPIIINGRVERPGEWGVYRFEGRAGEDVVAEVYARRLNSPLDSIVKLTDAAGKQLAINDDHDDKAAGLLTHQADSWLRATLPAKGTYFVHISDAQQKGGAAYGYRLRISNPRPDFELRVTPSAVNVRAGATAAITVYAIRRDGFSGDVVLNLSQAPAGSKMIGARIPAGQDMVKATISVPASAALGPVEIQMEGRATIAGFPVVRSAIPADNMMQAFFYWHLVPAHEWLLDVSQRRLAKAELKVVSTTPVRIPAGGKAHLQLFVAKSAFLGAVEFELVDPPDGLTIDSITPTADGAEIIFAGDSAKLKPGMKGNLIISAFARRAAPLISTTPAKPSAGRQRVPLGTLPAVAFEVVSD